MKSEKLGLELYFLTMFSYHFSRFLRILFSLLFDLRPHHRLRIYKIELKMWKIYFGQLCLYKIVRCLLNVRGWFI